MSVNTKYQHITHLADLPTYWIQEIVCACSPMRALHKPSVILANLALGCQGGYPDTLPFALALVKKQLYVLEMNGTLYLLFHSNVLSKVLSNTRPAWATCITLWMRCA